MEKTIKILLKEIIQENNYNITLDDINDVVQFRFKKMFTIYPK